MSRRRKQEGYADICKRIVGDAWAAVPPATRVIVISVAVLFLVFGLYTKLFRQKTWLSHTRINDIDVSGKTMEESLKLLPDGADYSLLVLGRKGGKMTISASDIDYRLLPDLDAIERKFRSQHAIIRFPWASRHYKIKYKCIYDKEKLDNLLSKCVLIKGSKKYTVEEPVSADIIYSKKEGKPVVEEETYGNSLNKKVFRKTIIKMIDRGSKKIDLDDSKAYPDMYKKPKVTADSKEIRQGVKAYNSYINRCIRWDMDGGESYTIKPKQIIPLAYYADGKMSCRIYKLEKLIKKFCDKYDTTGKTRIFTTHKGKKVKVTKGDYGWKPDFAKILDQAETALTKEIDEDKTKQYINNPSPSNLEKVTIHLKPQYKSEAFSKDYVNYQDWDPDNYTEVSIAEQMIYVHRNGTVAFKCKTISGLPVEGRETGKGVFYVKGRSLDRVLKGEDYETPVKYWIRLTTTGTGFHAAPWQHWDKWSKTYYKKHGSHGCLNLSMNNAKKMYDIILQGEAVFIY